jgi:hypothetical protein
MNPSEQFRRFAAEYEAVSKSAGPGEQSYLIGSSNRDVVFPPIASQGCPNSQTLASLAQIFFTARGNIRRFVGLATYCGD